jgi:rhomboid protease GluP
MAHILTSGDAVTPMTVLVLVAIALAVAHRATTPAERAQAARALLQGIRRAMLRIRADYNAIEPFRAVLRTRTPWPPMTPAVVIANVAIFTMMRFSHRASGGPDMLVAWGGSVGPQTVNGEWWRLVTALFVHSSVLQLIVTMATLVPVGLVVESLIGPVALAAAYLASGAFAGLYTVSMTPLAVTVGAAGAVAGLNGLMLAAAVWGMLRRPRLIVPLTLAKWLAGSAAVLLAYALLTDALAPVEVGAVVGLLFGVIVATRVNAQQTPAVRVAAAAAFVMFLVVTTAVPLRGLTDARSAIEEVLATETRTASTYSSAVDRFKAGDLTTVALADVIDGDILPQLRAARAHLDSLEKVPPEQQPLVASAEEYVQLRDDSWQTRSEALRHHSLRLLHEADEKEARSLNALRRIS